MDESPTLPTYLYNVAIIWNKDFSPIDLFNNVYSFKLDDDIYAFFIWNGLTEPPMIKTVWIKHPMLKSIEIDCYPFKEEA